MISNRFSKPFFPVFLSRTTITNKKDGKKKHKYIVKEYRSGFEYSHKLNRPVFKVREINRRYNEYYESVIDEKNDEVIHFCHESLTDHFGHGSAKKKFDF